MLSSTRSDDAGLGLGFHVKMTWCCVPLRQEKAKGVPLARAYFLYFLPDVKNEFDGKISGQNEGNHWSSRFRCSRLLLVAVITIQSSEHIETCNAGCFLLIGPRHFQHRREKDLWPTQVLTMEFSI